MTGILPTNGVPPGATQNGLTDPPLGPGCENLYYAARCNPRLDPFQANAVISELLNVVACSGGTYDCERLDNLCTAIRALTQQALYGCLTDEFPTPADVCSVESLVLTTDAAGCQRIARFTEENSVIGTVSSANVYGVPHLPTLHPANPGNSSTYYHVDSLLAAIATNSIDETRLLTSLVAQGDFTVPCAAQVELQYGGVLEFAPNQNGGNGATGNLVVRIDNTFLGSDAGVLTSISQFSNFERNALGDVRFNVAPGTHTIRVYSIGDVAALPAAQSFVTVETNGSSSHSGTIRISR